MKRTDREERRKKREKTERGKGYFKYPKILQRGIYKGSRSDTEKETVLREKKVIYVTFPSFVSLSFKV